MGRYVLGIDIGGTNMRLGILDCNYHLYDFIIEPSRNLQKQGKPIENLIRMIRDYLQMYGNGKEITAISAGFPSIIGRERKIVISTPNIKGFDNIAIVDRLEEEFNLPVFIETDVNMLVLYDIYVNRLPGNGMVCGFYLGTGIGNAIVFEGEVLVGKNGAAAELGHIPVRGIDGVCGCGNKSCIELIASGYKLKEICTKQFGDTSIREIFTKYAEHPLIKQYIDDVALAVATEINILDPDYLILGGGLTKMKDFPVKALEQAIYKYARKPFPAENLSFLYSTRGQENGVIGAGILAFRKLLKKEKWELSKR